MRPAMVAHADFGNSECDGFLIPVSRGEKTDLACNECGAVIHTVPTGDGEQTLFQMAMSQGFCSEICPACGELNGFPGFSRIEGYRCSRCRTRVSQVHRAVACGKRHGKDSCN